MRVIENAPTMKTLELSLVNHDYPGFKPVQGRASIADIYRKRRRCGIYILRFKNDEIYVGKAVDVTRRYVQHSKTHDDITHISFKPTAKVRLDEEERSMIWNLDKEGFYLRNILFTSMPRGESDFELVMTLDEQRRWMEDFSEPELSGTRAIDDTLRRKYKQRFQKFLLQPYADPAIAVLRQYVRLGIPYPLKSETSFWCCSCLPTYSSSKTTVYSRINVNWQEVLAVYAYEDILCSSFHLAITPLQDAYGESLDLLFNTYPGLEYTDNYYEPGGHDQINLIARGIDLIHDLLADHTVVRAIRLFNLRLMTKGPCIFQRYHCMDLADRLLYVRTAVDSSLAGDQQ